MSTGSDRGGARGITTPVRPLAHPWWVVAGVVAALAVGWTVAAGRAGADAARWGLPATCGLTVAGLLTTGALLARWRSERHVHALLAGLAAATWTAGAAAGLRAAHLGGTNAHAVGSLAFALVTCVAFATRLRDYPWVRRLALLSDAALASASVVVIVWELWIRRAVRGEPWSHATLLVTPSAALAFAAALGLVMFLQERSRTLMAAASTSCLFFIGDAIVAARNASPGGVAPLAAQLSWGLAIVGLAVAAGRPARRPSGVDPRPSSARVVAVYLPSFVAILLAMVDHVARATPVHWGTVTLLGVYSIALGLNQVVRWLETRTYADQLVASLHEIAQAGEQVRNLLDDLPMAVIVLDRDGVIRETNRVACDLTNRRPGELVGQHFTELLPSDDLDVVVRLWDLLERFGPDDESPEPMALSLAQPADPRLVVEIDLMLPLRDPDRVVITLRDVTRAREQTAALDRVSERFRLAFHGGPTGMGLATAPDGRIIDANVSLASMLGMTVDELVGRTERELTHPDDWSPTRAYYERGAHRSIDSYHMEKRYLRGDGTIMWARTWVSFLDDADGRRLAISHVVDVTDQRRAAEQLRWAATHDELTRLPNRARFMAELTERLASAPPGSTAVLFIDLDNFKVINDSLGHATGDQLLRGMTERLRAILRGRDMLSRFGGDEFIVLLSDCSADASPRVIAERLLSEIGRPLSIDGVELFVTGSIGIAVATSEATTASDLLRDADAAMYRAKARGRNCVEVFAPGAHDASVLALRTAAELRHAIDRHEIVPYYQPIVDLSSGVLTGFEVLARWRHPDRGLLGADQFLPMAEETGLIEDVGAAVLRASLVQLGRWRDRLNGFSDLSIAVNVSGRQLLSATFVDLVGEALGEAGVPAGSLWLEITETALMTDVKSASVALRELRSIGLHLSVDDFGTGYSSLTYLKRFPVEAIKIDRSFVNGLGIDAEDTTIVEAVVNLGHSLGLTVVAEGVETPLQLSRLRELGCDRAQGYLFGRPRPGEIIEAERALT